MDEQKTTSMENENTQHTIHNFSLESFKKSIENMIATSSDSYSGSRISTASRPKPVREYNIAQVRQIIESGTTVAQQELSYNYFSMDGFYRRIIIYYATLLKYLGLLIPNVAYDRKITDKKIQKQYFKAMEFVEKMGLPSLCVQFATKALIYGTYYGVVQTLDKDNFVVLDLPISYCSTRYKDVNNNDIIEFDLSYFDSLTDDVMRERALSVYPTVFQQAYAKYKKRKGTRYFLVPSEFGICLPLYDGRPPFISTIPTLLNYREYEDMEKQKDQEEVKKVLVQKIPHLNDGRLLFEPIEAQEIHRGTVGMVKKNESMSVLTTYGDVTIEGSATQNESLSKNNLEKISQAVYRSAGVSAQLFAATGNMALSVSIQNDLAYMMPFAEKLSRLFTSMVNRTYGTGQIGFKYKIFPVSYYNEKEFLDNAMKGATSGYSFLLPGLAMGFSQRELTSIKTLENDLLQMGDILIPLQTSYTTSGSPGRPTLPDNEKSDKTIQNIESQGNSTTSNGNDGGE